MTLVTKFWGLYLRSTAPSQHQNSLWADKANDPSRMGCNTISILIVSENYYKRISNDKLTSYLQGSNPPLTNTEASAALSGLVFGNMVSEINWGTLSSPETRPFFLKKLFVLIINHIITPLQSVMGNFAAHGPQY